MLKQLTVIAVKQLFGSTRKNGKKKFRLPPWATILLIGVVLCASFYVFFSEFANFLYGAGLGWVYFALVGAMVFTLILLTDIAMVQGQLFESTHNDILLAMPIKSSDILISRLISMLVYDYGFELCLLGTGMVAWIVRAGRIGTFLPAGIVVFFFWPLLPLALSCLVGFLLTRFTYKLKNKNLVKTLLVFGFVAFYYYITFTLETKMADLDNNAAEIARTFSMLKITEWFGKGIMHTNIKYILYIILTGVISMGIMVFILNKSFIKIITSNQGVLSTKEYKEKPVKERNVITALWYREFKRLGAYFNYLINALMPIVLTAAGIIFVAFKGGEFIESFSDEVTMNSELTRGLAITFIIGMSCAMMTTYMPSAASISLEGASMETLKSLPIDNKTIIHSKLLFHYSLMAPLQLFVSIVCVVLSKADFISCLGILLLPQAFLILTDEIGLCYNLLYPKLAWTNEAEVVKRGASIILYMFTSMIIGAIIVAVYFFVLDKVSLGFYTYMLIVTGVLGLLSVILYLVLRTAGARRLSVIGGE